MRVLHFLVFVNNICNRHCPDCYYPKGERQMSAITVRDACRWISSSLLETGAEEFKITFLGGEPFYSVPIMREIHRRIESMRPSTLRPGKDAGWSVCTNGDWVGLSIPEDLRKMRILVNPTDLSLSEFEYRLQKIKELTGWAGTSIVLDHRNLPRIAALAKICADLKVGFRTKLLYHGAGIPAYKEMFGQEMARALTLLLDHKNPLWPNWMIENFYPSWDGPQNPHHCGKYLATIDVDGTIRSCQADFETVMGHVSDKPRWETLVFKQRQSAREIFECRDCEWRVWCQAGCPYIRKLDGSPLVSKLRSRSPFCDQFKELFPLLMKLKRRWDAHQAGRPSDGLAQKAAES